jgi:hypothetical protein
MLYSALPGATGQVPHAPAGPAVVPPSVVPISRVNFGIAVCSSAQCGSNVSPTSQVETFSEVAVPAQHFLHWDGRRTRFGASLPQHVST